MASEVKRVLEAAQDAGWTVSVDGATHYRIHAPSGRRWITVAMSPSSHRFLDCICHNLRAVGPEGKQLAATLKGRPQRKAKP